MLGSKFKAHELKNLNAVRAKEYIPLSQKIASESNVPGCVRYLHGDLSGGFGNEPAAVVVDLFYP